MARRPLVLLVLALAGAGAVVASPACSSDVTPAPVVEEPRLCEPGKPIIPCDAGAPNALEACTGDPKATTDARLLPTDKSFPVGCRLYFPARDCTPLNNCYCREDDVDGGDPDAGKPAHWICER